MSEKASEAERIETRMMNSGDAEKYHHDDAVGAHLEVDEDALPPGYFRSKFFIGTMAGIGLGLMAGVAAYGYAAPILGIINADIGPVCSYMYWRTLNSANTRRTLMSSG